MENEGGAVFHDSRRALHDRDELRSAETHGIGTWASNHLIVDSRGLGWSDAYGSYVSESPWEASLLPSRHPCLAYCARGSAAIRRQIEGEPSQVARLGTGQFGMIPAGRASTWQLDGAPDIQHLYLGRDMLDSVIRDEYDRDPADVVIAPRIGFEDPLLRQLVGGLFDSITDRQLGTGLYADHLVRLVALRLLRTNSNLGARSASARARNDVSVGRVEKVRELIDDEIGRDLPLSLLASEVGVAPHRLAADFRLVVGVPLHRYVLQRRVTRARELLSTTDLPIAAIAYQVGFSSQSHLTTVFRRLTGATPGRFRTSIDT